MRVKLLTLMAGPDGVFSVGQVIDIPEGQAQHLIESGCAVAIEKRIFEETTDMQMPENTAIMHEHKKRKRH